MAILMTFILLIIILAVISIAVLFAPSEAGIVYWGSVSWVLFLILANWAAAAFSFSDRARSRSGAPGDVMGAVPGIQAVLLFHFISSVALLWFYNIGWLSNDIHVGLQIAFLAIAAVIVLLAIVAAKGAAAGSESAVSQAIILDALNRLQRMSSDSEFRNRVQAEINFVAYKLPHPSKLDSEALLRAVAAIEAARPDTLAASLDEFKRHMRSA